MNIVFFGSPSSAVPSLSRLIEAGHAVKLVVTQPDKPAGRGKKPAASEVKRFALGRGVPVYQPEKIRRDERAFDKISSVRPDIHVVVAYGQILPPEIIYLPRCRSVNVHFSLLPKYRGASPVQWAILNGETMTGVTIFELNERMDEGDILTTAEAEILPGDTARDLEARLAGIGASLLIDTIERIESIPRLKQDSSRATLAPKIRKDDGKIDWAEDAGMISRRVRAYFPWPAAFTFLRGKRLQVHQGEALDAPAACPSPGKILTVDRSGIDVSCGGGTVYRLKAVRPDGKKGMSAYSFSLGTRITEDDILG
jgi:methionyl-tRNA formyltransferase